MKIYNVIEFGAIGDGKHVIQKQFRQRLMLVV